MAALASVRRQVDRRRRGRLVQGRRVVADHPGRRDLRAERGPGLQHHLDPLAADAVAAAIVEAAYDLVLEDRRTGWRPRAGRGGPGRGRPRPSRSPNRWRRCSTRPTSRRGCCRLRAAVEGRLHPARAARLERAARRVQPHVAAVVHRPGDRDVVVGEEDEAVAHVGAAGELLDALDQLLARRVGGVGLAGEHELHRPVGCRAAGAQSRSASDSRSVARLYVAKRRAKPTVSTVGSSTSSPRRWRARRTSSSRPSFSVAHASIGSIVADTRPPVGVGTGPVVADDAGQQGVDAGRRPRAPVHAVGDRADRHLADRGGRATGPGTSAG